MYQSESAPKIDSDYQHETLRYPFKNCCQTHRLSFNCLVTRIKILRPRTLGRFPEPDMDVGNICSVRVVYHQHVSISILIKVGGFSCSNKALSIPINSRLGVPLTEKIHNPQR